MLNKPALNVLSDVEKLLFPVKLGPWALLLITGLSSCGYTPAYAERRPDTRLSVVAEASLAPGAELVDALMSGARAELSAAGVLASGGGYPRLKVQLLRVDEGPLAVGMTPGTAAPLGRGTTVGVTARAWVVNQVEGTPQAETGDVRRLAHYQPLGEDPRADALRRQEAVRIAAREVGRALGRLILGYPEAQIEAM